MVITSIICTVEYKLSLGEYLGWTDIKSCQKYIDQQRHRVQEMTGEGDTEEHVGVM